LAWQAVVLLLGLVAWVSGLRRVLPVGSDGPASLKSAAEASSHPLVAGFDEPAATSTQTLVDAAPPEARESVPPAPRPASVPMRANPASRQPFDAAKSSGPSPPSRPTPNAPTPVAPPSSLAAPPADSDWVPPDVPK
jgi:hypothetical protein